jgi:hypothetical protein
MAGAGYRLLGFAVWRGARWYVRRRLRPVRRVLRVVVPAAAGAAVLAAAVARRRSR